MPEPALVNDDQLSAVPPQHAFLHQLREQFADVLRQDVDHPRDLFAFERQSKPNLAAAVSVQPLLRDRAPEVTPELMSRRDVGDLRHAVVKFNEVVSQRFRYQTGESQVGLEKPVKRLDRKALQNAFGKWYDCV